MVALTMIMAGAVLAARPMAKTPPMGWNSWNKYACDISEQLILDTADQLISSGLAALGYVYVNIDDCK